MTPTITVSQSGGVTLTVAYQTNVPTFTGTTGGTDNAILRASGTSGTVIQGSLPTIADDGTLDAPAITVNGDPVALKAATGRVFVPVSDFFITSDGVGTTGALKELYTPVTGQPIEVINYVESGSSVKQFAEFDLVFPPEADLAQDITLRIFWRNASYPTAGSVGWFVEGMAFDLAGGDNPDNVGATPTPPSSSSADAPVRYEDFVLSLSGGNADFCRFQIYRQTPDSFPLNAYLIGAYITYSTL